MNCSFNDLSNLSGFTNLYDLQLINIKNTIITNNFINTLPNSLKNIILIEPCISVDLESLNDEFSNISITIEYINFYLNNLIDVYDCERTISLESCKNLRILNNNGLIQNSENKLRQCQEICTSSNCDLHKIMHSFIIN